jgi:hypothetical protein
MSTFRSRALKILARDAAIVVAIAAVVELLLQIGAPEYRNYVFDWELTGGHPLALNEDGLRGPLVPREKASGELRVLAVGDSTTYGTAVAVEDAWPAQLAELLRTNRASTSVINGGREGVGLKTMSYEFENSWASQDVDVVLLALSGNLVSRSWIDRDAVPYAAQRGESSPPSRLSRMKTRVNRIIRQLCLPSFLSLSVERGLYRLGLLNHNIDPAAPFGPMLAHGWRQADLDPRLVDEAWALFEQDLAAFSEIVESSGARLVVTILPTRFTLTSSWWDNEKAVPRQRLTVVPQNRFPTVCDALGLSCVDTVETLLAARREPGFESEPLYVVGDFAHLDRRGHQAVASAFVASGQLR